MVRAVRSIRRTGLVSSFLAGLFAVLPIVITIGILGWGLGLLAIGLLGALLKSVGKKRLESSFHAAIERIPLVNVLYRPIVVVVPTSPLPMSGAVIFAAADSVHRVNMQVDELMKVCLSIGVMASKVIPEQYVVQPDSLELREIGCTGLGRKKEE